MRMSSKRPARSPNGAAGSVRRSCRLALWTTLLAAAATPAAAQTIPSAQPVATPAGTPDIVVQGNRHANTLDDVIKDFTSSSPHEQLARWADSICIKVDGVDDGHGRWLTERIRDNLRTARVPLLNPPCQWNVLVAVSDDADQITKLFVRAHPGLYRDLDRVGFPGRKQVTELLKPRAIRWLPVDREFMSLADATVSGRSAALSTPHIDDASHITENTARGRIAEIFVVDGGKLPAITWQQLADYLTMVLLTDPAMGQSFHNDQTILSLFEPRGQGESPPGGLTDQDAAVIKAFAAFDPFDHPLFQRKAVARAIAASEKASAGKP